MNGKKLIELARQSISSNFSSKDINVDKETQEEFKEELGVFVTLTINGNLRGCIGFPEPIYPLWHGVIDAAKSAAFSDPRFAPLTEDEFNDIEIEISVLTKPELIKVSAPDDYIEKIKIGEDGLIIRGDSSGLLLPQVFTEYNCDVKQALDMLCEKAMLPANSWRNMDNKIYKFQAHIYSENSEKTARTKKG